MNPENILAGTANLFNALGDKTRLRLLNLMRDREICVSSFTGTLGHSQPLISRHLAYLRNSGIVEARRDGKWMHYRISSSLDENTARLLFELFRWMETQDGLRLDRDKYRESYPSSEPLTEPTPENRSVSRTRSATKRTRAPERRHNDIHVPLEEPTYEEEYREPAYEEQHREPVRHNELEDFLL